MRPVQTASIVLYKHSQPVTRVWQWCDSSSSGFGPSHASLIWLHMYLWKNAPQLSLYCDFSFIKGIERNQTTVLILLLKCCLRQICTNNHSILEECSHLFFPSPNQMLCEHAVQTDRSCPLLYLRPRDLKHRTRSSSLPTKCTQTQSVYTTIECHYDYKAVCNFMNWYPLLGLTGFLGSCQSPLRTCSDLSIFSNFPSEIHWIPLSLFTHFKYVNNVGHEGFWLNLKGINCPFPMIALFWCWIGTAWGLFLS